MKKGLKIAIAILLVVVLLFAGVVGLFLYTLSNTKVSMTGNNEMSWNNEMAMDSVKGDMYSVSDGFFGGIAETIIGSGAVGSAAMDEIYMEPELKSEFNTSEYEDVKEKGFLNVRMSPLSTFAADVDTGSYTNFRGIVRKSLSGYSDYYYGLEGIHDIRIEEMVNYFDYSEGTDEDFTVTTEVAETPWNKDTKLLVVNVKAKELAPSEHKGSNLVFLVDVSGSMENEDKLYLLIDSLELLVDNLTENDTVSLVTYASSDRVVFEGLKGNQKEEILSALNKLTAGGSTYGEGGIERAYKIAEKYKDGHSNSRIIMCSDGDLNVGMHSVDDLTDLIEKKREKGIYLSVLGFGAGNYKDNRMEALADNGNGNYHYIDCLNEGNKVLVEDMLSTTVTLADDVKFQLEFNPAYIKGYRQIGYENREMANEDFEDDTKDGGEVGYGHEVTVIYEIVPVESEMKIFEKDLKYQNTEIKNDSKDWLTVSVRHKPHGEKESILNEYVVDATSEKSEPSDNFKFISNVVAFGLLVNESDYIKDWDVDMVINNLKALNLEDEDKQDFLKLLDEYQIFVKQSNNTNNRVIID